MKTIVVPGEKLSSETRFNTYKDNGETFSLVCGVFSENDKGGKIVPIKEKYIPKIDDQIIGVVSEPKYGGAVIDINSPYSAFLPTKREYKHYEIISASVMEVDETNNPKLGYEKLLTGGEVISVAPEKIPRIIGKNNSMIDAIRNGTGCMIMVGRNGRIFIANGDIEKAKQTIKRVEKEAHKSGLTDEITKFLGEKQ